MKKSNSRKILIVEKNQIVEKNRIVEKILIVEKNQIFEKVIYKKKWHSWKRNGAVGKNLKVEKKSNIWRKKIE